MIFDPTIAVVGAGNVGGALIDGLLQAGSISRDRLLATTRSSQHASTVAEKYGISASAGNNADVASCADLVILGVKPAQVPEVIDDINPALRPSHVLVSMAAAVPIERIEHLLSSEIAVFRAMPSLAMSVRESATAIGANQGATREQQLAVERIFEFVGAVISAPEHLMHAVTALAASGPGFVCAVMEAMAKAGANLGLADDLSLELCERTFAGTAKLLRESRLSPLALRSRATTPGGTTAAGLEQLDKHGLNEAFIDALEAAARRSETLADELA